MTELAKRFTILYEESELSQEEFGKKFDASRSQVFHWRNGNSEPDIEALRKIATVCGVSVDWLVGKTNIRTSVDDASTSCNDDSLHTLPPHAKRCIEEFKEFMQTKYGHHKDKP